MALLFRLKLGVPFVWPSLSDVFFLWPVFLLPFAGMCLWILWPHLLARRSDQSHLLFRLGEPAGDVCCLGLILFLHFHIKLWIPLIHRATYDRYYEAIDRAWFAWLDPLIAWRGRWPQNDWIDHLYLNLFLLMFVISFLAHHLRGRSGFRRVFLASLLVQAAGALLYLVAPAVGPFLYHTSANHWAGASEGAFYEVRMQELVGGVTWLKANTGRYLTFGLAAMPSLHIAASWVFLYYAWRHIRPLVLFYAPIFLWILFEAMATRWHYGIDLVAGVVLAAVCIAASNRWMAAHEAAVQKAASWSHGKTRKFMPEWA